MALPKVFEGAVSPLVLPPTLISTLFAAVPPGPLQASVSVVAAVGVKVNEPVLR